MLRVADSQQSGRLSGITQSDQALAAAFPSMPTRNLCGDWQEMRAHGIPHLSCRFRSNQTDAVRMETC